MEENRPTPAQEVSYKIIRPDSILPSRKSADNLFDHHAPNYLMEISPKSIVCPSHGKYTPHISTHQLKHIKRQRCEAAADVNILSCDKPQAVVSPEIRRPRALYPVNFKTSFEPIDEYSRPRASSDLFSSSCSFNSGSVSRVSVSGSVRVSGRSGSLGDLRRLGRSRSGSDRDRDRDRGRCSDSEMSIVLERITLDASPLGLDLSLGLETGGFTPIQSVHKRVNIPRTPLCAATPAEEEESELVNTFLTDDNTTTTATTVPGLFTAPSNLTATTVAVTACVHQPFPLPLSAEVAGAELCIFDMDD